MSIKLFEIQMNDNQLYCPEYAKAAAVYFAWAVHRGDDAERKKAALVQAASADDKSNANRALDALEQKLASKEGTSTHIVIYPKQFNCVSQNNVAMSGSTM